MPLNLDPEAQAARDYAKRCVPHGEALGLGLLVSALYHSTDIWKKAPELLEYLEEPTEWAEETPAEVSLAANAVAAVNSLARSNPGPITPEEWFVHLLWSPAGMTFAEGRGIPEETLNDLLPRVRSKTAGTVETGTLRDRKPPSGRGARSEWRQSRQRADVLKELNAFGRMLTDGPPPTEKLVGMEEAMEALLRALVKRKQRSALIIGQPGTGKTALVREFARRLMEGHPAIPAPLKDHDVFELSSAFLRSGTTLVGQYDERVSTLIQHLTRHPRIILFVDEAHALLQSGIHERSTFTDANEAFKQAIAQGDISLIGATTTSEYRHYLEPDQALVQRFSLIRIQAPGPEDTVRIVEGRLPEIEGFYGVAVPRAIIRKVVALTEEYLPGRAQPRKSIQLLDEACAHCLTRSPALPEVNEDAVWEALEGTIGHGIPREETLTQEGILDILRERIVGQDGVLEGIARAFISGLGGWVADREAPRGVFFFGGPTGVGKTETAQILSRILGGGREALVRVDCNTLQPSGSDSGQALHVLLGPPPGYLGFVRGKGGALSRVREVPECIVLFDEIEKADPGVGEILLQIMDEGRCEDNEGNLLDFRRAFLVFTTNAGATYDEGKTIGFDPSSRGAGPSTDVGEMKEEIRKMGLGEEFLGRVTHFFIFGGLEHSAVRAILATQLDRLKDTAEVRGYTLDWDPGVVDHLVAQWQPRFGVRHLLAILRNRIVEQLSVADAQRELKGVTRIRLSLLPADGAVAPEGLTGAATRERRDDTLVIHLG